jgi:hypothetical protein
MKCLLVWFEEDKETGHQEWEMSPTRAWQVLITRWQRIGISDLHEPNLQTQPVIIDLESSLAAFLNLYLRRSGEFTLNTMRFPLQYAASRNCTRHLYCPRLLTSAFVYNRTQKRIISTDYSPKIKNISKRVFEPRAQYVNLADFSELRPADEINRALKADGHRS